MIDATETPILLRPWRVALIVLFFVGATWTAALVYTGLAKADEELAVKVSEALAMKCKVDQLYLFMLFGEKPTNSERCK